jgi:hypothetical protein
MLVYRRTYIHLWLFVFVWVFEVLSFCYTKYMYRMCVCVYIFFMSIVWIISCSFENETYVWNRNFVLAYVYYLNSKVIETIIKFKVMETIMIWILLIWFWFIEEHIYTGDSLFLCEFLRCWVFATQNICS